MTKLIQGMDGRPIRGSQHYAKDKLYYVSRYQQIFASGMKHHFPDRVYFDLMAGPGVCGIEGTADEFSGSPLLSLDADFSRRVFVESIPAYAEALRQRLPPGPTVLTGDCNDPAVISDLRAHIPSGALGLAFVDNLGLDVPLSTLRALTADRRMDLMIVFQVQDFTRNIRDVLSGADPRERVDAFFGDDRWEPVARHAASANVSMSDTATALIEPYIHALRSIGYPFVEECKRPMKNSKNAPQYRLLLAGKHERATDFFRKIQKIDSLGQRPLEW